MYMYLCCVSICSDGRPLPVRGIYQLDQGLYSVALEWNAARVPASSPILRYVITVIPEDQERSVPYTSSCYKFSMFGICTYLYCVAHHSLSLPLSLPDSLPSSEVFTEEVDHNRTSVELFSLQPASVYQVAVAGVNEYGTGNASQYHRVMTMSPEGTLYNVIQCTCCIIYIHIRESTTLYVGMTRTCLCRHTYEKLATAPTLHLLAFLDSSL